MYCSRMMHVSRAPLKNTRRVFRYAKHILVAHEIGNNGERVMPGVLCLQGRACETNVTYKGDHATDKLSNSTEAFRSDHLIIRELSTECEVTKSKQFDVLVIRIVSLVANLVSVPNYLPSDQNSAFSGKRLPGSKPVESRALPIVIDERHIVIYIRLS